MSFSFSRSGTIAEVREHVEKALSPGKDASTESRCSKWIVSMAVNMELLHLEMAGVTHVKVECSGYSDTSVREYHVSVRQDMDAERACLAEHKRVKRALWEQEGVAEGWLPKSVPDEAYMPMSQDPASAMSSAKPGKSQGCHPS